MFAYIVKRLIAGFIVVMLVSLGVFALFWYGPRDPAAPICQLDFGPRCTAARLASYHKAMGFDEPMLKQYGAYMKGIVAGREMNLGSGKYKCKAPCFGVDYRTKQPVLKEFKEKFPATLSIALGSAVIFVTVGVAVGIAAARRRGTLADRALVTSTLVMSSIPFYLVAILAFLIFTISFPIFPGDGYHSIRDPLKWAWALLLPWLVLGIYQSTSYTRYSRGAMVETLSEDYIRTARAKGLSPRTVVMKHALRAAIVPVVTIFGLDLATLLTGTVFLEQIFGIDGIGYWSLAATYQKNLPVVSTTALLASVLVVVANIIVDIIYSILDPRVRLT